LVIKPIATSSDVSMSPLDDQVNRDQTIHHSLIDQSRAGRRPVAARKPLRRRFAACLGIVCAVAIGSLINLIGGFPDEDPWSPY
jgi:hypothetical protein